MVLIFMKNKKLYENYRSGLFWKLFMNIPEVQNGLKKLGFESPYLKE